MKNLKKKGFTIVELVIVIAVVAVLAAVLIPTFSNLIKKANESVDIQLVRNMNVILEQDEALNGKPADIEKVKDILTENGISNPTPAYSESAFAWDSEENVIVLINSNTRKGVFPKEYEDVDYKSTWELLAGKVKVSMKSLGDTLEEALEKVELGQIIVLSDNQTLNVESLPKNIDIDLNGKKLTLSKSISMVANSELTLSNGDVDTSTYIILGEGSCLTLNNVNLNSTSAWAIYPAGIASTLNINGGSIMTPGSAISMSYSDGNSKFVTANINGVTFGSADEPCKIGISMINSGDFVVSNCTIYATEAGIVQRAGNMTIENTTINYLRTEDYVDTFLTNPGSSDYGIYTPTGYAGFEWGGGSGGMCAPIVIGDFYVKHYSFDANCTIKNVTVNKTNSTYPDVYLSQENYDVLAWDAANQKYVDNVVAGTEQIVKTTLTCDESVTWAVNPGKNDSYVDKLTGIYEKFKDYSGYHSWVTNGVALLYVDNVFVNGVEQAPGSTSANK